MDTIKFDSGIALASSSKCYETLRS